MKTGKLKLLPASLLLFSIAGLVLCNQGFIHSYITIPAAQILKWFPKAGPIWITIRAYLNPVLLTGLFTSALLLIIPWAKQAWQNRKAWYISILSTITNNNSRGHALLLLFIAALPSVLFYVFLPFFWNNTDAIGYFTLKLKYAMPQYPPLYNGLCRLLMLLTNGSAISVYLLILFQQIVYVSGIIYVSRIFTRFRSQLLFLILMAFNWTTLATVNGVFSEGLFAGFELFFWGGFFRFIIKTNHRPVYAYTWALSLVLLTLTKHIGQLWYLIPAGVAVVLLIAGRGGRNPQGFKLGFRSITYTAASFLLLVIIQHSVLWYLQVPNSTTIGRQGIYRIKEIPWNTLSASEKEKLLQHYTAQSTDPMLRTTFEAIIATRPWSDTYIFMDSVLKAKHIYNKTADDCLNQAVKAYMLHMEHYGIKAAINDLCYGVSTPNIITSIICFNRLDTGNYSDNPLPADIKSKWAVFFNGQTSNRLDFLCSTGVLGLLNWMDILLLTCINMFLLLVLVYKKTLSFGIAGLMLSPVVFCLFTLGINCMITVLLIRYILPGYSEIYMIMALLVAMLFTSAKKESPFER